MHDVMKKVLALNKFHYSVDMFMVIVHLVILDDVWMIELFQIKNSLDHLL